MRRLSASPFFVCERVELEGNFWPGAGWMKTFLQFQLSRASGKQTPSALSRLCARFDVGMMKIKWFSDLIFRNTLPVAVSALLHGQQRRRDGLTFCDKIVILLNSLLMESLVSIHFQHLTRTAVEVPLRHHYGVDNHRIVLLLDAKHGQRRWHLIFRWALRSISLVVALIDHLNGWIWRNNLVDNVELDAIPIGCKREAWDERQLVLSSWKLFLELSSWEWVEWGNWK